MLSTFNLKSKYPQRLLPMSDQVQTFEQLSAEEKIWLYGRDYQTESELNQDIDESSQKFSLARQALDLIKFFI